VYLPVEAVAVRRLDRRNQYVDSPVRSLPAWVGAVIVLAFVGAVILGLVIYRWRYGHYPSCSPNQSQRRGNATPPADQPPPPAAAPRQRQRRGVWRAEQPAAGLPGYTTEPTPGELSLSRRKESTEEYELPELHPERTSEEARVAPDAMDSATAPANNNSSPKPEALPPYVPPPAPAVVTDGTRVISAGSRRDSRHSRHSSLHE